jgi:pyruvate, orthophosphate dikinase
MRSALKIRTNADTVRDALKAVELGAEGIGLCRTEHMFFEADRIFAFRQMIVAKDETSPPRGAGQILPIQREISSDVQGHEGHAGDHPSADPPLHEFLPRKMRTSRTGQGTEHEPGGAQDNIIQLHELNPMMGHRGCRLAVSYPEIAEMQTRAIIEAAIEVNKEGMKCHSGNHDSAGLRHQGVEVRQGDHRQDGRRDHRRSRRPLPYMVGTMIEIPRAALTADEIAKKPSSSASAPTT